MEKKKATAKKEVVKPKEENKQVVEKAEVSEPVLIEPIEEVVKEINDEIQKEDKEPKKEFVSDWKELEKVEGHKRTDRGLFYYGVKKK